MKTVLNQSETTRHTASSDTQLDYREELWRRFKSAPIKDAELERSLGLFIRGSLLARLLATDEVYQKIVPIPGCVFDIGCWRGQASVMCENLRAIYEPFNKQRRIIAFDTFEGYKGFTGTDSKSASFDEGTYAVGKDYAQYLTELLEIHEGNNVLPHIRGRHRVIMGDATVEIPKYFKENPGTIVSLAFFDLGLYEPTKKVLESLFEGKRLLPGSILAFYHLTDTLLRGDGEAFIEVLAGRRYKIERSRYYPTMSFTTLLD